MKAETEVVLAVLAYSFCSGTLVLLNKLILHHLPFPSLVVSIQLVAALMFIGAAKYTEKLEVDAIKWVYVKPYLVYTVAFSMGVFCNMKSLSISNVETVIVFRALSPCIVSFLDAIFLGREYPSIRSWSALALIVLGTFGYASFDVKFQTQGLTAYAWPLMYLIVISFEMAYGKRIIQSVDLKTKSGPVLYTNLLGLLPMLLFAATNGEYSAFAEHRAEGKPISAAAIIFLILGCVTGTGIGYSSWWCRDKVSATSFTLIGVMNKCLTILINLAMWDQHAPPGGIAALVLCLAGGSLYQQAPMREVSMSIKEVASQADDVWETELNTEDKEAVADEEVDLLDRGPAGDGVKRRLAV